MEPLHDWRHSHEFRRCCKLRTKRFHKRQGARDYTVLECDIMWVVTDSYRSGENVCLTFYPENTCITFHRNSFFKTIPPHCVLNNRKCSTSKQNTFIYLSYDQQHVSGNMAIIRLSGKMKRKIITAAQDLHLKTPHICTG